MNWRKFRPGPAFNQRLDIFFSFGSGAAILLEALNCKRQAVGGEHPWRFKEGANPAKTSAKKERAARRIPARAPANHRPHTQCSWRQRGIRGEKGNRLSQRLYHLLSPSLYCQLSRVLHFSASLLRLFLVGSTASQKSLVDLFCHHGSLRSPFPRPCLHLHRRSRNRKSFQCSPTCAAGTKMGFCYLGDAY